MSTSWDFDVEEEPRRKQKPSPDKKALQETKQELDRLDGTIGSLLRQADNAIANGQSWRTKGMKEQLKPLQERWKELDDFRQYLTYASKLDFANKYQQELSEGKLTEPCHLCGLFLSTDSDATCIYCGLYACTLHSYVETTTKGRRRVIVGRACEDCYPEE